MVFPDLQGRLVGKRTTGRFFLERVADGRHRELRLPDRLRHGQQPGARATASRATSRATATCRRRADCDTIRLTPWVERTAMVMCDLLDVDTGEPIEVAPRQVLRRQVEAAAAAGLPADDRQRDRVLPLPRHATRRRTPRATAGLRPHSRVPARTTSPPDDEGRVRHRPDPPRPRSRRRARSSSARARPAAASTRSTSTTRRRSRWPTATRSTRPRRRRSPASTVEPSASWPSRTSTRPARRATSTPASGLRRRTSPLMRRPRTPTARHERAVPPLPRRARRHGAASSACSGRRRSTATSGSSAARGRRPAIGWGVDNRTLGFRTVGHGAGTTGRVPHPGQRREQLLRVRGDDRRRPVRHPQRARASGDPYAGQRLRRATTSIASRGTCPTRSSCGRDRPSPRSASATTCTTTSSRWPRPEWHGLQPDRHRLGAAALLRARREVPLGSSP